MVLPSLYVTTGIFSGCCRTSGNRLRTSRFLKIDGSLMNSVALLLNFTIQRFSGGNLDFDV